MKLLNRFLVAVGLMDDCPEMRPYIKDIISDIVYSLYSLGYFNGDESSTFLKLAYGIKRPSSLSFKSTAAKIIYIANKDFDVNRPYASIFNCLFNNDLITHRAYSDLIEDIEKIDDFLSYTSHVSFRERVLARFSNGYFCKEHLLGLLNICYSESKGEKLC